MTVDKNKPMPHGWGAAKEFPWMRQGYADFGLTPLAGQRVKVEWGETQKRCQNTLDRPIRLNEVRLAGTGAIQVPPPPADGILPNLAMRMGKTSMAYIDDWVPVECFNHNAKLCSYGINALATDSMAFELPTPYFLQRGASFGLDLRTRSAWYGGPTGTRGRMMLHGYDEEGKAASITGNLDAILELPAGVQAIFENSPGGVSGIHPRDMMVTHFSLDVRDFFTANNSEVDFSMYVEVRFKPNTGPIWVPSEDGWISLLSVSTAPAYPVVSCPLDSPIVLQPNEDFWIEFQTTNTITTNQEEPTCVVTVWAKGTQMGIHEGGRR